MELAVTVVVWPKTRPVALNVARPGLKCGPVEHTLNVARPGLKRGPVEHTILHNRNATSHATSKRRRPVLL